MSDHIPDELDPSGRDLRAYTDGKLSTRINHPMVRKVIETFAPQRKVRCLSPPPALASAEL